MEVFFIILQFCFWTEVFGNAIKYDAHQLGHIASEISRTGVATSEQKDIIKNLLMNNREKCHAIPFVEYIDYEGCEKVPTQNLLCFGSCFVKSSHFVNDKSSVKEMFGNCQPVKTSSRILYLNCSNGNKKTFVKHNITSSCSCTD